MCVDPTHPALTGTPVLKRCFTWGNPKTALFAPRRGFIPRNNMQTQTKELTYNLAEWKQGYRSQKQEYDYQITEIEGQIPAELTGTLFRNGPGMLDINDVSVRHPFDGDGMICRITLQNGKAHFCNRFVQTEAYQAEQIAGKFLYRGVFGTQKEGGWKTNAFDVNLKNIANTQVVYWGGKLLALWEAAEPHRLDPKTLDTLGIEYLNNTLKPGDPFAAHPLFDPNGRMVNFGLKAGKFDRTGLLTEITIYELDLDGEVVEQHSHVIPGFAFIHDFAITPNYCIFFQNPVGFNPFPFLFGLKGAAECVKFQPEKLTKILVIPRNPRRGEQMQTLETKSGFVFHHANAFEHDGKISIDSIAYPTFPEVEPDKDFREMDFSTLTPGQLWRFEMDLAEIFIGFDFGEGWISDGIDRDFTIVLEGISMMKHKPRFSFEGLHLLTAAWITGNHQNFSQLFGLKFDTFSRTFQAK